MPSPPTQHYLVRIKFRRKISFVSPLTISKWLKKYYFTSKQHLNKKILENLKWSIFCLVDCDYEYALCLTQDNYNKG